MTHLPPWWQIILVIALPLLWIFGLHRMLIKRKPGLEQLWPILLALWLPFIPIISAIGHLLIGLWAYLREVTGKKRPA